MANRKSTLFRSWPSTLRTAASKAGVMTFSFRILGYVFNFSFGKALRMPLERLGR